jgi:KaiC/GvpD/RAD55 family RecA-like ATPase
MGIPITIAGLNEFIPEIPNGNTILVEGTIEPIKTIFVQHLAGEAKKRGHEVTYITSRAKEEVIEQLTYYNGTIDFPIIEERSSRHWKDFIKEKTILVIDSYSYLVLDDTLHEVRTTLEELDTLCKQRHAIILLTVEKGMLEEKISITVSHIADGIIQFLSHDTAKGIARFIRIPKWLNRRSFDENIYYQFDGKRISIDLRARVT